jgi:hypothetical protein
MSKLFPNIQITRSKSHKVARQDSFGNWISDETFISARGECLLADMQEASDELMSFCQQQTEQDFAEIRAKLEHQGVPVQTGAPEHRGEPEENPFKVTAAPKKNTADDFPLGSVEDEKRRLERAIQAEKNQQAMLEQDDKIQPGAPAEAPELELVPEPKRRGRQPKTPAPEGPAAMEALKASVPPTPPPTQAFQATVDDLPENIAAVPHAGLPPEPPLSQVERLKNIENLLAKEHKRTTDVTGTALRSFIKAFLRVDRLPKPPDLAYEVHLPLFEQFAASYGGQMLTRPAEEGEKTRGSWEIFVRKIDAWPEGIKTLAKIVAVRHYPDEVTCLLEFLEIDGLTEPSAAMLVFLKLLRISRNSLLAARDAAGKRKVALGAVVAGLDLDLADEKAVLSTVAGSAVQTGAAPELWSE